LINWYLGFEFDNTNFNHIRKIYASFVCCNDGFQLTEYPQIGSLNNFQKYNDLIVKNNENTHTITEKNIYPINSIITYDIIKQLLTILKLLSKYDFIHGSPDSHSLLFSSEPCSYTYDNVYSSITIKSSDKSICRLFNNSDMFNEEIKTFPLKILNDIVKEINGIYMYNIKNISDKLKINIIYNCVKHQGLPLFGSSLDVYAFMVVLMSDYSFYESVMNDSKLSKLWNSMWLPEEYPQLSNQILLFHTSTTKTSKFHEIFMFLSNFNMRCDILSHLWNQID
jgi:hypothetical protein